MIKRISEFNYESDGLEKLKNDLGINELKKEIDELNKIADMLLDTFFVKKKKCSSFWEWEYSFQQSKEFKP